MTTYFSTKSRWQNFVAQALIMMMVIMVSMVIRKLCGEPQVFQRDSIFPSDGNDGDSGDGDDCNDDDGKDSYDSDDNADGDDSDYGDHGGQRDDSEGSVGDLNLFSQQKSTAIWKVVTSRSYLPVLANEMLSL